jgi:hypothetical protein
MNNVFYVVRVQLARVQRSIIVLGCICEQTNQCPELQQHHLQKDSSSGLISDLETAQKSLLDLTSKGQDMKLKTLQDSAINGSCFVCVKFCLSLDNEIVQSRAAQALCSIFIGELAWLVI